MCVRGVGKKGEGRGGGGVGVGDGMDGREGERWGWRKGRRGEGERKKGREFDQKPSIFFKGFIQALHGSSTEGQAEK